MAKAIVYPIGEAPAVQDVQGFRAYQSILGGTIGYMFIKPEISAYVHDEGLLIGLPENLPATRQVMRLMGEDRGWEWLEWNGPLRGPVIFVGPADADGETMDVPQEFADAI